MHRPRITTRQLSYLAALAETASFTRAAERLGISQPSLSQQIRSLELVIGAPLVERSGPAILTPLGREALKGAKRILLDLTELEAIRAASEDALVGTIRLGVSPTLGAYLLPSLVARLHREHPTLRVHIREGLPALLTSGLAAGDHDLILLQLPVVGRAFHTERLFRDALWLAMATDHPLCAKSAIAASDLQGQNLLTLVPEYRLAEQVAAIAVDVGANMLNDYEGTSLDAIRQMAGMGMGLALLPELYVRQEVRDGDDVVVRPIKGGRYYREIGLLWRIGAGRAPAYQLIADMLRAVAP
ncbi:hydrogen peroxide-inducible genes activator [Sphingomonas prati]|uniref:LysR family hydrogen peroxide-inducible transcriptional activator n=1 Tax=Sphingomonas prati TaxID=1843237 RepID=A0A7W9BT70_9SPHN|nr:hydrogen peroxide-inducible genes activator [Sphingomonas prati]MBB5729660.1 LysR family hydrogen peroxide-inducible transcriptional activator [Sphingomonas prati]GGE90427.1 hyaluronan synthase [Sphingomonas prati]